MCMTRRRAGMVPRINGPQYSSATMPPRGLPRRPDENASELHEDAGYCGDGFEEIRRLDMFLQHGAGIDSAPAGLPVRGAHIYTETGRDALYRDCFWGDTGVTASDHRMPEPATSPMP